MANKVDVFTEELSKVFTILQQQYVMIKYMKELITSGELDESEINKLKEQITAINNNIDSILNDQITPIKRNMVRIENGMAEIEKVIPTDINVDSNYKLILEHDGTEITGQKKQIVIPPWKNYKNEFRLRDDYILSIGPASGWEGRLSKDTLSFQYQGNIFDLNMKSNGEVHLKGTANQNSYNIKLPYKSGTVALIEDLANYTPISETNNIKALIPAQANKDNQLADKNFVNSSINSQIKDYKVYRHQLTLTNTNDVSVNCTIYSSNNLKIDSVQDFVTVVKPNADYSEQAIYLDNDTIKPAYIRYSASNVIIQLAGGGLSPVKTITDVVTTI